MKKTNILLLTIFLFSCTDFIIEKFDYKRKSIEKIGIENYKHIFTNLKDTFNLWILNSLPSIEAERTYLYNLDSLLCFNNDKNRFISCRHLYVNINDATSDDLQFLYGEKINNKWYFFKGASISVMRSVIKNQPKNTPLSYQQLHQTALDVVYSGYLNEKGEINEDWFTENFEGSGWGDFNNQPSIDWILEGKRFTNKKDFFEFLHLTVVKNNWNGVHKDSIKQLPSKNNNIP
ncbi:hypothetical protein [Sediminibacterium sp.]|uniref:hypothetical protein n=1 Tax=Sediminibacterium sp. TaxID=1917865 RepID=UPI0027343314|nr:hypothetical protein [Sediminibacterium sp.]MDP3567390.1 hypothetical protein [Sediminibacterium sp.]